MHTGALTELSVTAAERGRNQTSVLFHVACKQKGCRALKQAPSCWSTRSVWTMLSDIQSLGGTVWSQELYSVILLGPFQFGIFYNSMKSSLMLPGMFCLNC